jgi:hypothetical protein
VTTIVEAILSTLGDEPTSLADIAEVTGLEKSTLSPTLSDMKHKGLVERANGGWIIASGTPKRATHEARETAPSDPPTEPKRRGRRPRIVVPDLPPPCCAAQWRRPHARIRAHRGRRNPGALTRRRFTVARDATR